MSNVLSSLRQVFLAVSALSLLACVGPPDATSEASQLQLYQLVLSTALEHAEVEEATPQIQVNAVRITPDGVPFPGDRLEHYSLETSPALTQAAVSLTGVTLLNAPAELEASPPLEVFFFSNASFQEDTAATVGVRAARHTAAGYWGDAWDARLRWERGQWVLSEWVKVLHEDGG